VVGIAYKEGAVMTQNALRRRWKEGKAAVNGWLAIPSAFSAEVMAQCGWDSITVDLQTGSRTIWSRASRRCTRIP
jgi:2-keto-3-deoxy-L-rhamnonate aldolase RhmA